MGDLHTRFFKWSEKVYGPSNLYRLCCKLILLKSMNTREPAVTL